jgi:hypothetical protein
MPLTQVQPGLLQATGTPSSSTFLRGDGTWASAGAIGDIFYENGQTVSSNYTITSGKNAMSAGPIEIASGVTVTIPSGSTWVVV